VTHVLANSLIKALERVRITLSVSLVCPNSHILNAVRESLVRASRYNNTAVECVNSVNLETTGTPVNILFEGTIVAHEEDVAHVSAHDKLLSVNSPGMAGVVARNATPSYQVYMVRVAAGIDFFLLAIF